MSVSKRALEGRARRAARAAGLIAKKSRQRNGVPNLDNFGDFMLVDAETGWVVAFSGKYDLTAEDVIAFSRGYGKANQVK